MKKQIYHIARERHFHTVLLSTPVHNGKDDHIPILGIIVKPGDGWLAVSPARPRKKKLFKTRSAAVTWLGLSYEKAKVAGIGPAQWLSAWH